MQHLCIYQSLWAMEQRHPERPEPAVEDTFARVAAAGFHGLCLDPAVDEIPAMRALQPLFEEHGLACMINAFPATADELLPLLELAQDLNAQLLNVIGGVMPVQVDAAVPLILRWMEEGRQAGIPLLFETHRDSLLNDLYFTLQALDAVPSMRLCADLSHFVLDREMRLPLRSADRGHIDRILAHSDCFQGRVASREQIQVQLDFPQHAAWVAQFRDWWRAGMRAWRQRNPADASLLFLCELGPPPYAMTDARQEELSDRWEEALQIRRWVEEDWQTLVAEAPAPAAPDR